MKEIIVSVGLVSIIVSAVVGFIVWLFQKKIEKRDKKRDEEIKVRLDAEHEREKAREKLDVLLVEGIQASIELGAATANAVARIPDAHCNGDMHRALEVAMKVKEKQSRFLMSQGIQAIQN